MKPYLFVSDIHLGVLEPEKDAELENSFVTFLEQEASKAGEIFILGDLFDYWFEYRRVIQKGYFNTFAAMHKLVKSGVKVNYLIGNHDFMHRDFFEKSVGVNLIEDAMGFDLDGTKFFLGHGDGLIKNDIGYKILKAVLRNKKIQWLYSLVHPDFGVWLASSSSKKSRNYTSKKNYGENDSLFEVAKEKIDSGYDYVLFGHSHSVANREYNNGKYINLGTWLSKPLYGKFYDNKFEIIEWNFNG